MKPSRRWPAAIVGLIGFNMIVVAITVYFATHDPSAAVEPDYYQKAVNWDAEQRERAASDRLGWTASVELSGAGQVAVQLVDRERRPVGGAIVEVTAFAEARAGARQRLTCTEVEPGRYVSPIDIRRPGLWRFEIGARRGGDVFMHDVQLEHGPGAVGEAIARASAEVRR